MDGTARNWEVSGDAIWGWSPLNARVRLATIIQHSSMNGIDSVAVARLMVSARELDAAAGIAITALAFAQEDAQRRGDAVAYAQNTAAKEALIAAQNKARGRGLEMTDVTPQRAAISATA